MTEDELSQKRKKLNDEEQKNRQSFDSWAEEFRKRHETKKSIRKIETQMILWMENQRNNW